MKYVLGSLATFVATFLVAGALLLNGNIAWVQNVVVTARSEQFVGEVTCTHTIYRTFGFQHTIVNGLVLTGGSSAVRGGYVVRTDYLTPALTLHYRMATWGESNYYGDQMKDDGYMVADACGG